MTVGSREITIDPVVIAEGDSGQTRFTFIARRTGDLSVVDAFTVRTVDGTATSEDYTSGVGTFTFGVGVSEIQISGLAVIGDTVIEGLEAYTLEITIVEGPNSDTVTATDGTVVILEDDGDLPPVLRDIDVETNFATPITIDLSDSGYDPNGGTISVVSVGTAVNGSVVYNGDGTATFTPNGQFAGDARFVFTMADDSEAGLRSEGTVEIAVGQPGSRDITVGDAEVIEGDGILGVSDYHDVVLTITRTGDLRVRDEVTVGHDGTGSASSTSDFNIARQTVIFEPGVSEIQVTFSQAIIGDRDVEETETFGIDVQASANNPFAASLTSDDGTVTILDDDVIIAVSNVATFEGDTDENKVITFTVSRDGDLAEESGEYTVSLGGGTATADVDYVAQQIPSFHFAAGEDQKTFSVTIIGDDQPEADETLFLSIFDEGALVAQGEATIHNDDVTFSVEGVQVDEGGIDDQTTVSFTVTRTDMGVAPTGEYSVSFSGSATEGVDYIAQDIETIQFQSGVVGETQTISFTINGDIDFEPDETVVLTLRDSDGTSVGTATSVIRNDDSEQNGAPSTRADAFTIDMGEEFTFTTADLLANDADPEGGRLSVTSIMFDTVQGNIVTNDNGSYTFTPAANWSGRALEGVYSVTDGINTAVSENFTVDIRGPASRTVSVSSVEAAEGDNGSTIFTYQLTRSAATSDDSNLSSAANSLNVYDSIRVFTGDASSNPEGLDLATAGLDYTAVDTTVIFAPGETVKTVTVEILADETFEMDEIFQLYFDHSGDFDNFVVPEGVTGTIVNDDPEPLNRITGTVGNDVLNGTDRADEVVSLGGRYDLLTGGDGADHFVFGTETDNGRRERDQISDYEVGVDQIVLANGTEISRIYDTAAGVTIQFAGDGDLLYVMGEGVSANTLTIVENPDWV